MTGPKPVDGTSPLVDRVRRSAFFSNTVTPSVTTDHVDLRKPTVQERAVLHQALMATSRDYQLAEADQKKRGMRVAGDLTVHLGLNQVPTIASLVAGAIHLPAALGWLCPALSVVGVVTGVKAIARDVKEMRESWHDPRATRLDRFVDIAHLGVDVARVAADCATIATLFVPALAPVTAPVALAIQVTGIAADVGKALYDLHRRRQSFDYLQREQDIVHQALPGADDEAAPQLEHRLRSLGDVDAFLSARREQPPVPEPAPAETGQKPGGPGG